MTAVLTKAMLLDVVAAIAPSGPAETAAIGLWPARHTGWADLSTNAAIVVARRSGRPAGPLAEILASRLQALPQVAVAAAAGVGFVNIRLSDDAIERLLPRLLAIRRGPGILPPGPIVVPLDRMTPDDPGFRIQYAHARCRSVLRAAEGAWPAVLDRACSVPRIGPFPPGVRRRLLCQLEQHARLAGEGSPPGPTLQRPLQALATAFEDVWIDSDERASVGSAMMRFLDRADADRTLIDLALVAATADALRHGLAHLGLTAAEEIR